MQRFARQGFSFEVQQPEPEPEPEWSPAGFPDAIATGEWPPPGTPVPVLCSATDGGAAVDAFNQLGVCLVKSLLPPDFAVECRQQAQQSFDELFQKMAERGITLGDKTKGGCETHTHTHLHTASAVLARPVPVSSPLTPWLLQIGRW